jgi:4-amino-4-deoxy-L-arabinose transferase-like glycosyltransferase
VLTGEAPRAGGRTSRPGWLPRLAGLPGAALAALVAAAVSFAGIGSHSLWTPDEPRDAAIGKAMWASGDLVVPRLDGRPFLEKPPLAWWAQAAAFRALGVSDAAARVPSALFGTLTLLVTWGLGRRLGGVRAGWLAAGALASTAQYGEDMHRAIVDPPLVLMVTLAWAGFVLLVAPRQVGAGGAAGGDRSGALEGREGGGSHSSVVENRGSHGGRRFLAGPWAAYLLIGCAVPLAFLAKGVVGIGLALGPPVLYLLGSAIAGDRAGARRGAGESRRRLAGNRRKLGEGGRDPAEGRGDIAGSLAQTDGGLATSHHGPGSSRRALAGALRLLAPLAVLGVPLFAAVVVPWGAALLRNAGWPALRETLVGNTVGRLVATESGRAYGHRQPFWYYVPAAAVAILPWTLALPALLRGAGGGGDAAGRRRSAGGVPAPGVSDLSAPAAGTESAPGLAAGAVRAGSAEEGRRLLLVSFLLGVALLSLAASKRTLYLVPLLPGLAVPVGLWLDRLGRGGESRRDRRPALLLLGVAAVLPPILWLGGWAARQGAFHSFPVAPLRAALPGGHLAAAGLAAAAAAGLLLHRLARHLRAGTTPAGAWLVVPYLALGLIYQTAIKAAIDPLKNLHDLTAAIARLDPGSDPVVAYRPSETTLGIVEFDLGRGVRALSAPGEVAAFFANRPAGRLVLSLDALRHLPPELRARLWLLYDESATKASPFGIAGWDSRSS